MSEALYKLDPQRTMHLAPSPLTATATAAMHSTSATGFTVCGTFRDRVDKAELILWDADDFFGHPRWEWLPDFDFSGMVLQFDLKNWMGDPPVSGIQPIDSPKYPWIPWDVLTAYKGDGSVATAKLWDHATLQDGAFTPAAGVFHFQSSGTVQIYDRVVLSYQNIAWDYIAPSGGESLADVAAWFADAINDSDWNGWGPPVALMAASDGADLTLTAARYGHVNVASNGLTVTWVDGVKFIGLAVGNRFRINGEESTVASLDSNTQITLASAVTASQSGVSYTAPRGGYDGNMCRVSALHKTTTLQTTAADLQLAGGSSEVIWRLSFDFDALGLTNLRKLTMAFAPRLTNATAYSNTEWTATFENWTVTGGNRALKIADPSKSVRVGSRDAWVSHSGTWEEAAANAHYRGFARRSSTTGASVTVRFACAHTHNLYLDTYFAPGASTWSISVDGDTPTTLSCVDNNEGYWGKRKIRTGLSAGQHTAVLTLDSAAPTWFNFLEAVVESDVPDAPETRTDVGWSIDFDTDHTYRLPPERLVWQILHSGLTARINEYLGLLYYAQRTRAGGTFPSLVVTFGGTWADEDTITLTFGGIAVLKRVYPQDTLATIAAYFRNFINQTFSAVWAQTSGDDGEVLTVTVRSPIDAVTHAVGFESDAGTVEHTGELTGGDLGLYRIDPALDPALDYACRSWHADFFAQLAAAGMEAVVSFAMDMTNPPAEPAGGVWASRYINGDPAGFTIVEGLGGIHCTFSADVLDYQKRVFLEAAALMSAAGLPVWLQFGEFMWWYVQGNSSQGMAYYDDCTKAEALTALGRALYEFQVDGDPSVNSYADANFLRDQLEAHIDAITAHVQASYPGAFFELLWAHDVGIVPIARYIDWPLKWNAKAGSGLDVMKMEGLSYGAYQHNMDFAREAMLWPMTGGRTWAPANVWYNLPVLNPYCPWRKELRAATAEGVKVVMWAWDHFCFRGEPLPIPIRKVKAQFIA